MMGQIQLQMNTLDHEQLLEHEYNLLNQPGSSLSNFCLCEYNPLFLSPSPQTQKYLKNSYRMNTKVMKAAGSHSNSIFQIFSVILLKIFYDGERNLDMLQHLKCILYSPDLHLNKLQSYPNRNLSTVEMKKLVVEFFQVMRYGTQEVEIVLARYPIVLEIFCVFLRTILAEAGMQKLTDWRESGDPSEILMVLCDYLDVDYQMNKDVYFLNHGEFFVYIREDGKDIAFGLYRLDRSNAPSRQKQKISQDFDFDFNMGESQTMENPEISPSKDMPTPCFNQFNENECNFNTIKTQKNLKGAKKAMQEICEEEEEIEDAKKGLMMLLGSDQESDLEPQPQQNLEFETPKQVGSPVDIHSPFSMDMISGGSHLSPFSNLSQLARPNISASIRLDNSQQITMMKKEFSQGLLGDQNRLPEGSKSDFYFGQRGEKSEKIRGVTEASFLSCICTQNKINKINLQSNVINLSIQPPETIKEEAKLKKVLSNPGKTSKKKFMKLTTNLSKNAIKKVSQKSQAQQTIKYNKIPEFLKQRNTTIKRENTQRPFQTNGMNFESSLKEKVAFTYSESQNQTVKGKNNYRQGVSITMKNSEAKDIRTQPTSYSPAPIKKTQSLPLREHQRMPSAVIGGGFGVNRNYGPYNMPQKKW